jgi:hypothetical protein
MEEFHRMTLKMPIELANWMKEIAKDSERSLNGQIVAVLKEKKVQQEGARNAVQ